MFGRSVGLAAACALGASAFIIPAGIAPSSNAPDLSVSVVNPKEQVISIPCASCAFPTTRPEEVEDVDGEGFLWIQGGAHSLVLNFSVSEDGEHLQLNGEDIYGERIRTMQRTGNFHINEIYVKQVPTNADLAEINTDKVPSADLLLTAYGIEQAEHQVLSPNGDELVPLTFHVMGLENQPMILDDIEIGLLQTGNGELLIMQVENIPTTDGSPTLPHPFKGMGSSPPTHGMHDMPSKPGMDDMPHRHGMDDMPHRHGMDDMPHRHDMDDMPHDHGMDEMPHKHGMDEMPPKHMSFRPHGPPHGFEHTKECNMLPEPLCKLKNILESKIDAAMGPGGPRRHGGGCRGRKGQPAKLPGHIKPHLMKPGEEDVPNHHHSRPHHVRPHGPHHGHDRHRHGRFSGHHVFRAFAKGLVAILIPVTAGITVGMTVSLLGLIVGRLIAFVWIRLVRGGRRGYASVALEDASAEEGDEESKPMLAEMEASEALPSYEAAPAYEEVNEKEQK